MISIVIPARNEEKLLPDCLRSLRNQTYQGEYEIIVVNNGSMDATAGIAQQYGARVIPADKENSVSYARQKGADAAHGDIIAQADADTVYPPYWLQRIADRLDSHPEAMAISGRFVYRDKFVWAFIELFFRHFINVLTVACFGQPLFISGATFAFRRREFVAAGGYHNLTYAVDQHGIASRLHRSGKILYDKDLNVITSARSVQKPNIVLILALIANAIHLFSYLGRNLFTFRPRVSNPRILKRLAWGLTPVLILAVAFSAYGYFVPASPVFGKVYSKAKATGKLVALTFDDGPNEPYTSRILDILKDNNIKATFFVIGKNVELYPDTARRILAEGHVLGNHSYSHNANHALTDFGSRDLQHAEDVIFNITGVEPHLYRPPHGKKTPWELEDVKENKLIEVTWSDSANDQHRVAFFGKPTPEAYAGEIVRATRPGEIILLHDGYGTLHDCQKSDRSLTVQSLPLIIKQLQDKGYKFVTVPDLLGVPAYNEVK
jgi:peptidoglycan/xylan/chitin deacetylase (PgdA/CDA1 family)